MKLLFTSEVEISFSYCLHIISNLLLVLGLMGRWRHWSMGWWVTSEMDRPWNLHLMIIGFSWYSCKASEPFKCLLLEIFVDVYCSGNFSDLLFFWSDSFLSCRFFGHHKFREPFSYYQRNANDILIWWKKNNWCVTCACLFFVSFLWLLGQ